MKRGDVIVEKYTDAIGVVIQEENGVALVEFTQSGGVWEVHRESWKYYEVLNDSEEQR